MKIIKSIYQDANGNTWEIEMVSLNKLSKKGEYVFWQGECSALNKTVRGKLKRDVINQIKLKRNT
jgi:hypothetical protein